MKYQTRVIRMFPDADAYAIASIEGKVVENRQFYFFLKHTHIHIYVCIYIPILMTSLFYSALAAIAVC